MEATPEFVARALIEMDSEINNNKITIQEKWAYIRAIELHNHYCRRQTHDNECCYVCTNYFRVRFLKVEQYNAQKAAIRYCRCLNVLHKYFGDIALMRQLYISDLRSEELKFLKNEGMVQLLHSRDSVGRRKIGRAHV